jgi:hypothetical protein
LSSPPDTNRKDAFPSRVAAGDLDARLRRTELAITEQRLDSLHKRGTRDTSASGARIAQLEAKVLELEAYLRAIRDSKPWRLIQWFRRLTGRAW